MLWLMRPIFSNPSPHTFSYVSKDFFTKTYNFFTTYNLRSHFLVCFEGFFCQNIQFQPNLQPSLTLSRMFKGIFSPKHTIPTKSATSAHTFSYVSRDFFTKTYNLQQLMTRLSDFFINLMQFHLSFSFLL